MRDGVLEGAASIKPNPNGFTYSDYGRTASGRVECRDKVGWFCHVRGIDEKEYKAGLCQFYRQGQGQVIPTPVPTKTVPEVEPVPADDEATLDGLGERLNYPRLELSPWSRVAPGRESWEKFKRFRPEKIAAMLAVAVTLL
jgi:hypothetical protein